MRTYDPLRHGAQFYHDQLVNPLSYYKKRLKKAEVLLRLAEEQFITPELDKKIKEFFQK